MFNRTRLKLTLWYLGIIMLISVSFSSVIYKGLDDEVGRFERAQRFRIERGLIQGGYIQRLVPPGAPLPHLPVNSELLEEARGRIILLLIGVNIVILLVSGGLGYLLAGITLRPIKEMIEEQHRFISDASHELRTPLTSLKSAFEVYLRDKAPTVAESKVLAKESIEEVDKLQSLADSLLKLARFEKPDNGTTLEKISLLDLVKRAVKKTTPAAHMKHIHVEVVGTDIELTTHPQAISDLFVILLDNAIKYSSPHTIITITIMQTDHKAGIEIKDQGMGIEKKDLPHLFERFYRGDVSRSKSHVSGYGLGLSIAKKIVDEHKGKIVFKSENGKGTTVSVILPIK